MYIYIYIYIIGEDSNRRVDIEIYEQKYEQRNVDRYKESKADR